MLRKDREVTDKNEIYDILKRCDNIHLGINNDKYPYIVPLSFGTEMKNNQIIIYFHCAKKGMKMELLSANPYVCVESEIFYKVQKTLHGITSRYESIIGFGKCEFLSDEKEIIYGLKTILSHYGNTDYPVELCKGLDNLYVGKIIIEEISGKRNLVE